MRSSCTAARITDESGPYSFASRRGLVTTAGVKRMFSSVCSPVYGGSFHGSLKRSGGRGFIPGFCVFGAGAGDCAAEINVDAMKQVAVRNERTMTSSLGGVMLPQA